MLLCDLSKKRKNRLLEQVTCCILNLKICGLKIAKMAPGIGLQFGILVFVLLFKPSGGKTYVRLGHFIPGLSVGDPTK